MANSFFFYDLETSGIRASRERIMQFGGQRTDLDLKPIGKPVNIMVRLTPDILPAPEAILLSRISPTDNLAKGISEAEFSQIFNNDITVAGTIFTGFNNLRFDDEFMRYLNYRNFYDAYAWHWKNDSSRWDILDVVRMTRALRPDGINWPYNEEGKPSNKLEQLTLANKLSHANAHDALADALATIDVARLIKKHQPKLFSYLLSLRKKSSLAEMIKVNETFVYTSSHYPSDVLHTTVVSVINYDPAAGSALVYDLRNDPRQYLDLSIDELSNLWEYDPDQPRPRLPLKTMKLNRCPAIAPLSVLDEASIDRLKLDMDAITVNSALIAKHKEKLAAKLKKVTAKLDAKQELRNKSQPRVPYEEERLYDGFIDRGDVALFDQARDQAEQPDFEVNFSDKRLNTLYERYRARNYPKSLNDKQTAQWQEYVRHKLFSSEDSQYSFFTQRLKELRAEIKDKPSLKLLDDLELYGRTIANDYGIDLPDADV